MPSEPAHLKNLYFHGLPGSAQEIQSLLPTGASRHVVVKPLDLPRVDRLIDVDSGAGFHVIGFSLGAMSAIQIAAQRTEAVKKLTLIAPAAPLELGDFLPKMAGRVVFQTAQSGDFVFRAFTAMQRMGVAVAPDRVMDEMFAKNPKADRDLLSIQSFRVALKSGLQSSLGPEKQNYHKAVRHYVQPWAHFLDDVSCAVTIHHGTLDNWAPLEMSLALKHRLKCEVDLISYEGLGHYSVLHAVIPDIF